MDPTSLFVTLLIAVVSSLATAHFALWRFRKSNWWERKADAYEKVIDALSAIRIDYSAYMEEEGHGYDVSDEERDKRNQRLDDAMRTVRHAYLTAGYMLGEDARNRIATYFKDVSRARNAGQDWFSYLDERSSAAKECLDDVIDMGRKDLGV